MDTSKRDLSHLIKHRGMEWLLENLIEQIKEVRAGRGPQPVAYLDKLVEDLDVALANYLNRYPYEYD